MLFILLFIIEAFSANEFDFNLIKKFYQAYYLINFVQASYMIWHQ